jgi:hypothetical protein
MVGVLFVHSRPEEFNRGRWQTAAPCVFLNSISQVLHGYVEEVDNTDVHMSGVFPSRYLGTLCKGRHDKERMLFCQRPRKFIRTIVVAMHAMNANFKLSLSQTAE